MSGQSHGAWTASLRFAQHALSVEAAGLPSAVQTAVKQFTLDTLGVGAGGAGSAYAGAVLRAAAQWGEGGQARVWAGAARLPAAQAAFVNAFMAHAQEFDCVHEGAVLHPFTAVVPVLLAEADRQPFSGLEFLAACAAGVDVAAGLGVAATSQIQFFRPATCGLFGAIAALGHVRRLEVPVLQHAFGFGLGFAAGTMQAHVEGTPVLAAQVGNAARAAFQAVDLAQAGLPGPSRAIDGPFGYLALFERSSALAPVLETLGKTWRAAEVSWKPYPTGRAAHGGIAMMLELRAKGLRAEDVEAVEFRVTPLIQHLVGRPALPSPDVNYARLCLPYAAATALVKGAVGLDAFSREALSDRAVYALAQRFAVRVVPNENAAAFVPQDLTVTCRDGRTLTARIDVLPGTPQRPLSAEEQMEKLRPCLAFGWPDGPDDAVERLADAVNRMETLANVSVLTDVITS